MADAENSEHNSDKRGNNLIPFRWKKGQSGNPGGRPKRKPITDAYKEILQYTDEEGKTAALALGMAILNKALSGDVGAAKEIADRVEGTVRQSIDILFGDLSDDQLKEFIQAQYGTVGVGDFGSQTPEDRPADGDPGSTKTESGGESNHVETTPGAADDGV